MCTVRQHLLHLGQKVNERQKERRKRKRTGNHEKNAMYCNLQCFSFFIVKTVVYCIVLKKKYTNFVNSWKEENIRLMKVTSKKREFLSLKIS